ncbi:hypothetical protein H102_01461, partial [Trichophyton rubrum CBS 100081]
YKVKILAILLSPSLGRTARLPTSLGTSSRNGNGNVSLKGLHIEHHEAQIKDYNFVTLQEILKFPSR